jgi:hypothetical protein
MPRRWRHVLKKLTLLRGNGGKKARSPGRARKKPLKPIAQGRPGISGEPVVTCLRAFYFCTQGCGCAEAPGFPCALSLRGMNDQSSGRGCRGDADSCLLTCPGRCAARERCAADPGPMSMPIRSCIASGTSLAAPQHDRIHHPANGQWPFGRLLCKGSQQVTKTPESARQVARFPSKMSWEEPCGN